MKIDSIIAESQHKCPHCGGPVVEYSELMEKKDACYYKVKASAKVWPSAYASGRLVQCRKKGAGNYGNKSEGVAEGGYPEVDHMPGKRGIGLDSAKPKDTHVKTFHASKEKEAQEFAKKNGYIVKKHVYPKSANNSQPHEFQVHKNEQGVAEVFANPGSGSTGTARGAKRIATTVRKALAKHPETPEQIAARKDFEARIDARRAEKREQGVAEGSKEKTPGIALSKAYKKDFDNKKPGQDRAETALTGTYSKTGKPGGELKKQGVAEAATPASVSKVLRLIQRHHSDWFDTYGMGEVEDAVVDMAEMGQFRGTSAAVALKLVGDELESMYGQQGVAEAKAKTQKKEVVGFRSEAQFKTWKQYAQKEGYEIREAGNLPGSYAAFDDNGKRVGYFYNEFDLPNGYYYVGELITSVEQGVAEGYGRNSQAYQDDGGANDERHDLDPSDWYIVKDGKMYKTSVYPNQVQQAIAQGYSRTRDEAKAKADQQGVAEDYNPEYDDEAGMVENNLETLDRAVEGLDDLINSGDNLPEWCQEKIAVAKSMLVGVWDYMYSEEASDEVDPEVDEMFEAMDQLALEMAQKKGVSVDLVWETFEAMDDHMLYETAAWRRKEGKSAKGGLNAKGVASYRRENPGSKLQTAVTTKPSKLKPGSKAAKRRKSFCARMGGVKGPMKKPNGKPTRKALALRKWNC